MEDARGRERERERGRRGRAGKVSTLRAYA
jgi:hypothetical protein